MNRIVGAGNGRTDNHRGTVTFIAPLRGMPSEYSVIVTAAGAQLDQLGAHIIGYELDGENNFKGFDVYTDEVIGDFSWIVVQLVSEEECDVHVKWFGAKGDGNADDTAAVQDAIIYGANRGNFNVFFGPGIFLYSSTLSLPPGNHGITLIGSRDAAAQQGSVRPVSTLRWIGGATPTVTIASTFTTFVDMAVENAGGATYFAEVEPSGAGRVKFYRVSCQAGADIGGGARSKPFSRGFLKSTVTDYSRIERCEFAGAAPVIVDMDGAYGRACGGGTTTFIFADNVLDTSFDTDVFRITNCSFEILTIVNNTFNAQPNSSGKGDTFFKDLGFIYADSGLTVVNSMNIDQDAAMARGSVLGNLIFRDNEYDDTAYDDGSNPASSDAEKKRLARVRMLKLRRTLNVDLENNNIEGNGQNAAIVDLMDSVAHVGKNFAHSTGVLIQTLDAARQDLTLEAAVDSNGAVDAGSYTGIVNPTDLNISGPNGDALIRATRDADDAASHIEGAKSAISTAAAINDSTPATGVTATTWAAVYTLGGGFSADVNIDGVIQSLTINGQPVVVNLVSQDGSPAPRKQALVDAINMQVIGVSARILCDRAVLIAADGRNTSLTGTGTTAAANSVGKEVLNFTTAVLAESVVARGGVTLHAEHGFSSFSNARGVYGWGTADRARVFFKHNNVNFGSVSGLVNKDTSAGIVKMTANPDQLVVIFGQLGDPGGVTTFQFDIPDNRMYTISIAESQSSPPYYGSMTRGQKVLVVTRNMGSGAVRFSQQFKTSGLFTSPGAGKSRAILFEYVGTVDYPKDPQNPLNPYWNGYMVERWCSPADVDN